jgi:hypothetical protein
MVAPSGEDGASEVQQFAIPALPRNAFLSVISCRIKAFKLAVVLGQVSDRLITWPLPLGFRRWSDWLFVVVHGVIRAGN